MLLNKKLPKKEKGSEEITIRNTSSSDGAINFGSWRHAGPKPELNPTPSLLHRIILLLPPLRFATFIPTLHLARINHQTHLLKLSLDSDSHVSDTQKFQNSQKVHCNPPTSKPKATRRATKISEISQKNVTWSRRIEQWFKNTENPPICNPKMLQNLWNFHKECDLKQRSSSRMLEKLNPTQLVKKDRQREWWERERERGEQRAWKERLCCLRKRESFPKMVGQVGRGLKQRRWAGRAWERKEEKGESFHTAPRHWLWHIPNVKSKACHATWIFILFFCLIISAFYFLFFIFWNHEHFFGHLGKSDCRFIQ